MSVRLRKAHYLGCVTALLLFPPSPPDDDDVACHSQSPPPHTHLLVARGSTLYLHSYPSLDLLLIHQWTHHSQRIHGIACSPAASAPLDNGSRFLCLWGGPRLQLLRLTTSSLPSLVLHATAPPLGDLIWSAVCLTCPSTCLTPSSPSTVDVVVCLAHNSVAFFSIPLQPASLPIPSHPVRVVHCSSRCLLYSASFCGVCIHSLCVLAGTVLASTLLWSPSAAPAQPPLTLRAHEGSVFSIAPSLAASPSSPFPLSFLSASDDRTVRRFSLSPFASAYDQQWVGYGHEARVWRVRQGRDGYAISAGEDDTIRVWKDGKVVEVWNEKGRKGGAWTLDLDLHRSRAIAGFVDGRVRILDLRMTGAERDQAQLEGAEREVMQQWRLSTLVPPEAEGAAEGEEEYCRAMARGFGEADVFVATSRCRLFHFRCSSTASSPSPPACSHLFVSPLGHPAVTLSLSLDQRYLAVGDSRGNLVLLFLDLQPPSSPVTLLSSLVVPAAHTTGISFIHFLSPSVLSLPPSSTSLLTADAIGDVRWWRLQLTADEPSSTHQLARFRLPIKAHLTCAVVVHLDEEPLLLCGDSKGNVYVYQLRREADSVAVYASCRLSGVHYSFSCLLELDDGRLLSAGKDGCLHHFDLRRATAPPPPLDASWISKHNAALPSSTPAPHLYSLSLTATTRVPVSWLVAVHRPSPTSPLLAAGFTVDAFQVWDVDKQLRLMSAPCAGHNRPFVFTVNPSSLSFLYASHSPSSVTLISHTRPLLADAPTQCIGAAFHSRLATAVRVLSCCATRTLFATVGEDGLMKWWSLAADDGSAAAREGPQLVRTFHDHPDSIRTMAVLTGRNGDAFVFTAGGKDHLRAYRMRDVATGDGENMGGIGGGGDAKDKGKLGEKKDAADEDAMLEQMDVRIMSMAVFHAQSSADSISPFATVAVGDSAGELRLYAFDRASTTSSITPFTLLSTSPQHGHPVISLAVFHSSVLASGDTAGRVCLWDVSSPSSPQLLFTSLVHQAGVNASVILPLPSSSPSLASCPSSSHILITGGDDGCICLLSFSVQPTFLLHRQQLYEGMHDSAIKSLAIHDGCLLSSGYDQRLRVWTVQQVEGEVREEDGERKGGAEHRTNWRVQRVCGVQLELADVSGLDCAEGWIFACGQGLSILRWCAER